MALVLLTALGFISLQLHAPNLPTGTLVPPHLGEVIKKCRALHTPAGVDEALFHKRTHSDRFVPGTKPTLIRNARIWTGNSNGTEVINGSILLDRGMIKALGRVPHISAEGPYKDLVVVDANGAWVTPGSEHMLSLAVFNPHECPYSRRRPLAHWRCVLTCT